MAEREPGITFDSIMSHPEVVISFLRYFGEHGIVKPPRFIVPGFAIAVLALAAAVRLHPSSLILLSPGVKVRSPYCSVWKASLDGSIKLRQESRTEEIFQASRFVQNDHDLSLWDTPKGRFWVPGNDGRVVSLLLAQEERDIYGKGEWGVHRGDVVLDVGAYIGTWTKDALARGAKLVVAIEPSPASVECLKRNLSHEIASGQVIIYPKGIWDSEGKLALFSNSSNGVGNSFVEESDAAQKIDAISVTTIDKVSAELQLPRVDFIKADVKGATERLLRGAGGVIRSYTPRIAVSTEEVADNAASIATLARLIQPSYQMKDGPCLLDNREVYTDVLFFR
jgi:FkbM family methyltransferase